MATPSSCGPGRVGGLARSSSAPCRAERWLRIRHKRASSPAVPNELAVDGQLAAMSFLTKMKNKSRITRGRAKMKLGRATGNRRLQWHGVTDRIGGNVRQAGERLKDTGRDLGRSSRR